MGEVSRGAAKPAFIELVGPKGMLYPGLSNLFEAVGVARSPTHSIEIMRNDRMVCTWQHEKVHGHVSGIARGRAHTQTDVGSVISKCFQVSNVSRDDIRAWVETFPNTPSPVATGSRISRAVAQEQNKRECEITQYFPKHGPLLQSGPVQKVEVLHPRRQSPLIASCR